MTTRSAITASLTAALVVAALAGCTAGPEPVGPASDPGPLPAEPTTEPQGNWTPDSFFYEVVEGNRSSTATLIEQWESNDCTVQAAVDGGTGCSTFISTGGLTIETYAEIFTDYQAGAGAGLDDAHTAITAAQPAALQWTEQECNWETTEGCAEAGQSIMDGVYALEDALAAWESTR